MGNLYKFDTVAKYNDKKGNLPYINVSYVSENDTVYYNDEKSEIEQQPLTVKIIALPNETYCRFWFKSDPEANDQATFVKYKVNDGDWVSATDIHDIEIDDCQLNDEIQIIADWRRGLQSTAVWKNNTRGEGVEGAKIKIYGNWFSTVNGYDYATNPHFIRNENDYWDSLYAIRGENSWQIADISDIWIPTRCIQNNQYMGFYSELGGLTGTTDIRLVTSDDNVGSYGAFYRCCSRSNITSGTIGADHTAYYSFFQVFNESAITTLTIEKLDRDLNGHEIAGGCSNLTTIYNYTNHFVKIANDFNSIPQSGTLYYVDYGQDMQYTPSSMVPSGWTCTAIQNPNT